MSTPLEAWLGEKKQIMKEISLKYPEISAPYQKDMEQAIAVIEKLKEALEVYAAIKHVTGAHFSEGDNGEKSREALAINPEKL